MAKDIHPTYYPQAKVKCACGNEYIVGSTLEKIEVEACSKCHPFYTGKERGAVSGGRIERFQKRVEKKEDHKKKSEKRMRKQANPNPITTLIGQGRIAQSSREIVANKKATTTRPSVKRADK